MQSNRQQQPVVVNQKTEMIVRNPNMHVQIKLIVWEENTFPHCQTVRYLRIFNE